MTRQEQKLELLNKIMERYGKFSLVEDIVKILPIKKRTLYKKLNKAPSTIFFKQKGFVIVVTDKFINFFLDIKDTEEV
ncbi:MAG: hypothetical protein ACRCZI_12880 [Cetobacterium sp.]